MHYAWQGRPKHTEPPSKASNGEFECVTSSRRIGIEQAVDAADSLC
jgi:hypothetical protein